MEPGLLTSNNALHCVPLALQVSWSVLQGVLLDQLPPGSVTLQAGFEGFEQDGQVSWLGVSAWCVGSRFRGSAICANPYCSVIHVSDLNHACGGGMMMW
jgi:hypothetical protein